MADKELTLESFIRKQLADIETALKNKEDAFRLKNKAHYDEMDTLKATKLPIQKLLRDFDIATGAIEIKKPGRKIAVAKK